MVVVVVVVVIVLADLTVVSSLSMALGFVEE